MVVLLVLNEFVKHTASSSERVNGKEQKEVGGRQQSNIKSRAPSIHQE